MLFDGRPVGARGAATTADGGIVMTPSNLRILANAHGLNLDVGITPTHQFLVNRLARGPLMICGNMPTGHCFVIGGVRADQLFHLYDPTERGGGFWGSMSRILTTYRLASAYMLQRAW